MSKKNHAASYWSKVGEAAVCAFVWLSRRAPLPVWSHYETKCQKLHQNSALQPARSVRRCTLHTSALGCRRGMKDGVWSCGTSFPSELIRTDRNAESLGGRRAQEAGVGGGGGGESSSSRSGAWMLSTCRVFLVVLFFFSPFCSCQEWKHRQPQQRDRKEIFNLCFEHMWYSRLQPLRGRQYMKQSLSFLCGFVRSAHCKMAVSFSKLQSFYVKGCKVLSARLQHKPVFTFDSLIVFLIESQLKRTWRKAACSLSVLLNWSTNVLWQKSRSGLTKDLQSWRFYTKARRLKRNPWNVTHPPWQPSVAGIFSRHPAGTGQGHGRAAVIVQ